MKKWKILLLLLFTKIKYFISVIIKLCKKKYSKNYFAQYFLFKIISALIM